LVAERSADCDELDGSERHFLELDDLPEGRGFEWAKLRRFADLLYRQRGVLPEHQRGWKFGRSLGFACAASGCGAGGEEAG
jgi:hypothetical protein